MTGPWGTGLLLADKSAWARSASAQADWDAATDEERIVTCPVVELELLYSARSRAEVHDLRSLLSEFRSLAVTRSVMTSAVEALTMLADAGSDGHHRVSPADAIIAACAAENGAAVLHHDHHYDRLADVLPFTSVWLHPAD